LVKRSDRQGLQVLDVEGGVLDVEFVVQFLQLINGGDDRQIRNGNTIRAIRLLEQNGAVTSDEAETLENNYQWLRRVEHRLEVLADAKSSTLPEHADDLRSLALRCGYAVETAAPSFQADYEQRIDENQHVITHLLSDAFDDEMMLVDAETDLVMDPDPRPEAIRNILSPYGFRDPIDAFHHLSALGRERIPFLSTRRCRYFLSLISRPLLWAISKTPAPDATLANLVRVSDSLGGKGVLWELFYSHRASLDLYVRLCSSSPYLTAILTRYPGMIDELMDSLMLAELPTLDVMHAALDDLAGGAPEDWDAALHSFKNTQHLNVGVRELLGKVDIRQSTRTLADVAEACLHHVAHYEYQSLLRKLGEPRVDDRRCGFVVVGMGKLGGREPNYHSDADFIVLYESDGNTFHPPAIRHRDTTSNGHFFGMLAQRMVKAVSENRKHGRLYESDPQLRPIGKAGPASVSLERFREHYLDEAHPFSEIRELCRARPLYGPEPLRAQATAVLKEVLQGMRVTELDAESVRQTRRDLEETAGPRNLKRGPGGTLDVEFVAQVLQLRNCQQSPAILQTNTVDCLAALAQHKLISPDDCQQLTESYLFLRLVEAMLRLVNTRARHDLPRERDELAKLAYLMRFEHTGHLERECAKHTKRNRKLFSKLI
jgi:glutamate-ammonia-ligase adenylyltransferase